MSSDWVIVADGAQARFLVFGWHDGPRRGALRLSESSQLSNPECTVSGRRDGQKLKNGHDSTSYRHTDYREQHDDELQRRFASRIGRQTHALVMIGDVSAITLVTSTRMMGLLKSALQPVARAGISLRTLQRDYTWCSPAQIQQHLGENGLIPMHYGTRPTESSAARSSTFSV